MGARSPRPWPWPAPFPSNQVSFSFPRSPCPASPDGRWGRWSNHAALAQLKRVGRRSSRGAGIIISSSGLSQPASQEEHSISERDRPRFFWVPDPCCAWRNHLYTHLDRAPLLLPSACAKTHKQPHPTPSSGRKTDSTCSVQQRDPARRPRVAGFPARISAASKSPPGALALALPSAVARLLAGLSGIVRFQRPE
jgi:hypothetical protein